MNKKIIKLTAEPSLNYQINRQIFLKLFFETFAGLSIFNFFNYGFAAQKSIVIKAVGDLVLPSNYQNTYSFENNNIIARVKPLLQDADIVLGNLEGPITKSENCSKDTSLPGYYAFRYPLGSENLLKSLGFNIVHIANNHINDFKQVGVKETKNMLKKVQIDTIGIKNKILFKSIHNIPLALIGFDYNSIFNNIHDNQHLKKLIAKAKKSAKILIVSMHAGAEGESAQHVPKEEEIYLNEQRGNVYAFAHRAIDLGADLVIGFGPHVLRGIEVYKNKLIAYSLGNFFGCSSNFSNQGLSSLSLILEVRLDQSGNLLSAKGTPIKISSKGIPAYDLTGSSLKKINKLSKADFPTTGIIINDRQDILALKPLNLNK